jgi:very-short-patch-repair endonuclease
MPQRTPYDDPRFAAARAHAADQGGVVSRPQLYALGITRYEVRGQVRAGRWQLIGDQSVCLHNGEVSDVGHQWAAIFQGGPRACLDGSSALVAGGLERFTVTRHRVSVPRGARVRRTARYDIRQTRRWSAEDLAPSGIPRTRPAVAAVRAGLWAASDRQAVFVITLVVQQGMATPEQLGEQALRIKRDRRRRLIHLTILDLLDGARSLGELDVVRELRRRGLPPPSRQVLRQDKAQRYYLDLYWDDFHLVVEIDGIHHAWATNVVGDALRQNSLVIDGDRVLRLPLLGLRLEPDAFFEQIEEALVAGGRQRPNEDVIRAGHPLARSV